MQGGLSVQADSAYRDADLLAGDAITNYRTVASFGHDELILDQYDKYIDIPTRKNIRKSYIMGFLFGSS
jgi:ABC-type transport system involved in Fe-S cluster assembly fused permease/ATPase subunit